MPTIEALKVDWVSLVDRAASRDSTEPTEPQRFLLWKRDGDDRQVALVKPTAPADGVLLTKADQQLVYGVVLQPGIADSQGDVVSAMEIEKAAHDYMVQSRRNDVQHDEQDAPVDVVESYIAPSDLTIGGQPVVKGAWVMGVHVTDSPLWQRVVKRELTGFSIGGSAVRVAKQDPCAPAGRQTNQTTTTENNMTTAYDTIQARAATLRKSDSALTQAEAQRRVLDADRDLQARYLAEQRDPEQRRLAAERLRKSAAEREPQPVQPRMPAAVNKAAEEIKKADPSLTTSQALVKAIEGDADLQLAYLREVNPRAAAAWEAGRR